MGVRQEGIQSSFALPICKNCETPQLHPRRGEDGRSKSHRRHALRVTKANCTAHRRWSAHRYRRRRRRRLREMKAKNLHLQSGVFWAAEPAEGGCQNPRLAPCGSDVGWVQVTHPTASIETKVPVTAFPSVATAQSRLTRETPSLPQAGDVGSSSAERATAALPAALVGDS